MTGVLGKGEGVTPNIQNGAMNGGWMGYGQGNCSQEKNVDLLSTYLIALSFHLPYDFKEVLALTAAAKTFRGRFMGFQDLLLLCRRGRGVILTHLIT